jgi:hypothetical protein
LRHKHHLQDFLRNDMGAYSFKLLLVLTTSLFSLWQQ